jgi:pheromone shutdown protein TraB
MANRTDELLAIVGAGHSRIAGFEAKDTRSDKPAHVNQVEKTRRRSDPYMFQFGTCISVLLFGREGKLFE